MRPCPSACEWYRGCPNEALIYYAFSDRWLCGYCIGYTRIGRSVCSYDGWRSATCVDAVTQSWYCGTHAHQCEELIERPAGHRFGGAHGCLQRAINLDGSGHWYCAEHQTTRTISPVPSSPLSVIPTPAPPRPVFQQLNPPLLPATPPRSTLSRPVQVATPTPTSRASGFVAQIASAISALSSVLISPGRAAATSPYVTAAPRNDWQHESLQQVGAWVDLDAFSKVVDTECCICLETYPSLRRLIACDHMFCEACLSKQLNSSYARRHDCALCRADMFDIPGSVYETF